MQLGKSRIQVVGICHLSRAASALSPCSHVLFPANETSCCFVAALSSASAAFAATALASAVAANVGWKLPGSKLQGPTSKATGSDAPVALLNLKAATVDSSSVDSGNFRLQ